MLGRTPTRKAVGAELSPVDGPVLRRVLLINELQGRYNEAG